jgi:hypothetical protein
MKPLPKSLPVDYYTGFCELGDALTNDLNFLAEAQAMKKIDLAISHDNDGKSTDRPVAIPLPVGELVSQRVLVMDFVEGLPLNKLQETMKKKGIESGSQASRSSHPRFIVTRFRENNFWCWFHPWRSTLVCNQMKRHGVCICVSFQTLVLLFVIIVEISLSGKAAKFL